MAGTELQNELPEQQIDRQSDPGEQRVLTEEEKAIQQMLGEAFSSAIAKQASESEVEHDTAKHPIATVKELGFPTITIEDGKVQTESHHRDGGLRRHEEEPRHEREIEKRREGPSHEREIEKRRFEEPLTKGRELGKGGDDPTHGRELDNNRNAINPLGPSRDAQPRSPFYLFPSELQPVPMGRTDIDKHKTK